MVFTSIFQIDMAYKLLVITPTMVSKSDLIFAKSQAPFSLDRRAAFAKWNIRKTLKIVVEKGKISMPSKIDLIGIEVVS